MFSWWNTLSFTPHASRLTPHTLRLTLYTLLLTTLLLTSCGFHLRGQSRYTFDSLYISGQQGTPFYSELQRTLRFSNPTRVVDSPEQAEAILTISNVMFDKQILSLSGGGRVREFLLIQNISFRVHDNQGHEWLPANDISIRRDFSYSDSQALAKEAEERLLWQDMQSDAIQQLLRRLQAAKKP